MPRIKKLEKTEKNDVMARTHIPWEKCLGQ